MFRGTVAFLDKLGVYDVVLPFLLVFTIVFAILEKTKVLGTDEINGVKYPKKNLNSMIAFVTAMMVIASSQLVRLLNEAVANLMVVLIVMVLLLLLIGSFYKEGEEVYFSGKWRTSFTIVMIVSTILIVMNALKTSDGRSWLSWLWMDVIVKSWGAAWFSSLILIAFIVIVIALITKEPVKTNGNNGGD